MGWPPARRLHEQLNLQDPSRTLLQLAPQDHSRTPKSSINSTLQQIRLKASDMPPYVSQRTVKTQGGLRMSSITAASPAESVPLTFAESEAARQPQIPEPKVDEITESDLFLIKYMGSRTPIVPLGELPLSLVVGWVGEHGDGAAHAQGLGSSDWWARADLGGGAARQGASSRGGSCSRASGSSSKATASGRSRSPLAPRTSKLCLCLSGLPSLVSLGSFLHQGGWIYTANQASQLGKRRSPGARQSQRIGACALTCSTPGGVRGGIPLCNAQPACRAFMGVR